METAEVEARFWRLVCLSTSGDPFAQKGESLLANREIAEPLFAFLGNVDRFKTDRFVN